MGERGSPAILRASPKALEDAAPSRNPSFQTPNTFGHKEGRHKQSELSRGITKVGGTVLNFQENKSWTEKKETDASRLNPYPQLSWSLKKLLIVTGLTVKHKWLAQKVLGSLGVEVHPHREGSGPPRLTPSPLSKPQQGYTTMVTNNSHIDGQTDNHTQKGCLLWGLEMKGLSCSGNLEVFPKDKMIEKEK